MSRLKPLGFALLMLLGAAGQAAARQGDSPYFRFQDRGTRWEGTITPSEHRDHGRPVALTAFMAHGDVSFHDARPLPPQTRLAFYLPEPLSVSLRGQNTWGLPTYNLEGFRVDHRPGVMRYNYSTWTTEVARQYGFKRLNDFNFVAELASQQLTSFGWRHDLMVAAPVMFYQDTLPDHVRGYSIRFNWTVDSPPRFSLYWLGGLEKYFIWSGGRLTRVRNSPAPSQAKNFVYGWGRPTWGDKGIILFWYEAPKHPEGWYYISAKDERLDREMYGVVFYHVPRPYDKDRGELFFQNFRQSTGEALKRVSALRRRLEVLEVPGPGAAPTPASHAFARGRQPGKILAYRLEDVQHILRAGRSYLAEFKGYLFAGIREYVDREYPSEEAIPSFPDPRGGEGRLVEKSAGDRILSKAVAVLKEMNSLPSLTVIIDVSSLPGEARVALLNFKGEVVGNVVTDDKLIHIPRAKYVLRATKPGHQAFQGEINLMRSRVYTSIACTLYAEHDREHTSRCNNPR